MWLSAEFLSSEATAHAVAVLERHGFMKERMEVFSITPVDAVHHALDRPSHMSLSAVAGAVLCGGGSTAFMLWTQSHYPLITGGMPLHSLWPIGVITFETAMAGAILGVLAAFLWESELFSRKRRLPAPELRADHILMRLECASEEAERAKLALRVAGAAHIRTLEAGP